MKLIKTASELQQELAALRSAAKTISFVPTMGALHAGHLSLVELAKRNSDVVVVSVFVNPLQFGAGEDFDRYPRTLKHDLELLTSADADFLFAPSLQDIYPNGQEITQRAGVIGSTFEGASRTRHFDGMLTVVNRLMEIVEPNSVVFGEKDAQQVFLVRKLIAARWPKCIFLEGPTWREANGLALSSRNRFLTSTQLLDATKIFEALTAMSLALESGTSVGQVIAEHTASLEANPKTKLEYLAVINPRIFRPVDDQFRGEAKIIVALRVGDVRLIDNLNVTLGKK